MSYYNEFLVNLKNTITEEEICANVNYNEIFKAVKENDISHDRIIKLFKLGEKLATVNIDEAQEYFMILSEIPNLPSSHCDLAIESCLILEGIERDRYDTLEQLIKQL
ncbi:hypothetical protein [Flavobacterium sp.]|uniref:hypothetical protein n=1 Tax=Flavobacterium sp. TaxID=239 RepID=UPI003F696DA8